MVQRRIMWKLQGLCLYSSEIRPSAALAVGQLLGAAGRATQQARARHHGTQARRLGLVAICCTHHPNPPEACSSFPDAVSCNAARGRLPQASGACTTPLWGRGRFAHQHAAWLPLADTVPVICTAQVHMGSAKANLVDVCAQPTTVTELESCPLHTFLHPGNKCASNRACCAARRATHLGRRPTATCRHMPFSL